jgi:PAS domain S-box-containing protein
MALEFQGEGFHTQDFFEAHREVNSFILENLARLSAEEDKKWSWLKILEDYLGDLLAGFAMEKLRIVKTISRRRQQEAKRFILLEKKRYAAIFYQMEEPSFVVDRDLRLVDLNPACERFFGISSDQLIGLQCCDLIGSNHCVDCPLEKVVKDGGSFSNIEISISSEKVAKVYDGEDKTTRNLLLAGASLAEGVGGPNSGAIVIIQDITERKSIEQELDEYRNWLEDLVDERTEELLETNEKLQKEIRDRLKAEAELVHATRDLKRSNADLEQFAHVASHDLKEPLMLIASFTERINKGYSDVLDDRGLDYLGRMGKATLKLQELVDALLQLSSVSASSVKFTTLDMKELVRDVVGDLDNQSKRVGASVEIDDLHDLDGDEVQIRQLLQNIISNALKYIRKGVVPSVKISSRIIDDICELSVEDNGIGLFDKDLERIFEPFVRLHSDNEYEGSGMGLATCQKIVQRHGGNISACNKTGDGSIFIIRLPLRH